MQGDGEAELVWRMIFLACPLNFSSSLVTSFSSSIEAAKGIGSCPGDAGTRKMRVNFISWLVWMTAFSYNKSPISIVSPDQQTEHRILQNELNVLAFVHVWSWFLNRLGPNGPGRASSRRGRRKRQVRRPPVNSSLPAAHLSRIRVGILSVTSEASQPGCQCLSLGRRGGRDSVSGV